MDWRRGDFRIWWGALRFLFECVLVMVSVLALLFLRARQLWLSQMSSPFFFFVAFVSIDKVGADSVEKRNDFHSFAF